MANSRDAGLGITFWDGVEGLGFKVGMRLPGYGGRVFSP